MKTTSTRIFTVIAIGMVTMIGLSCSLANAATIAFTDSDQLNLSGRDVLAAVNFYAAFGSVEGEQGNFPMTGPLQGVTFQNVDITDATAGSPETLNLSGGGTLDYTLAKTDQGRRQFPQIASGASESDKEQAWLFASGMTYFAAEQTGRLAFDFGTSLANTDVEVQIPGGDAKWTGTATFSINSVSQGTIVGDSKDNTAHLLTFDATTDTFGKLTIDIAASTSFIGFSGVTVTTAIIPEPASFMLLLLGGFGLLFRRPRQR